MISILEDKVWIEAFLALFADKYQQTLYRTWILFFLAPNELVLGTAGATILINLRKHVEQKTGFFFQWVMERKQLKFDIKTRSPIMEIALMISFMPYIYSLADARVFMLDQVLSSFQKSSGGGLRLSFQL